MHLKNLGRFRQKNIKERTPLKIQLTAYVDRVFPELGHCAGKLVRILLKMLTDDVAFNLE